MAPGPHSHPLHPPVTITQPNSKVVGFWCTHTNGWRQPAPAFPQNSGIFCGTCFSSGTFVVSELGACAAMAKWETITPAVKYSPMSSACAMLVLCSTLHLLGWCHC